MLHTSTHISYVCSHNGTTGINGHCGTRMAIPGRVAMPTVCCLYALSVQFCYYVVLLGLFEFILNKWGKQLRQGGRGVALSPQPKKKRRQRGGEEDGKKEKRGIKKRKEVEPVIRTHFKNICGHGVLVTPRSPAACSSWLASWAPNLWTQIKSLVPSC